MAQCAQYSSEDDCTLITTLLKQARYSNQSENGFKKQAYLAAANALAGSELVSGGKVKSQQSIQDRFLTEFVVVRTLRGQSGFGWDEENSLVMAPEDVWKKYLEAHPEAKKWCKTPFPLYDDICSLVDGTVATGEGAYRPGEDEEAGNKELEDGDSRHPPSRKRGMLPTTSATLNQRARKCNGKVTAADSLDQLTRAVGDIKDTLVEPPSTTSDSPSTPKRHKEAIMALAANEGVGLTPRRKVKLIQRICKNPAVTDTYMALADYDELRTGYLQAELAEPAEGSTM
ncbi:hypothetical protein GSI_10366 [Ganoderma sinense ZZ0214-1]|uniref:Myb/SANT-like domain-containing protein n=1 Tax=Ganoderma sinense ZZ0214-1 TaxID=1077348 RepID=A0A2G8S0C6_9APHY|nr:hypothetical protein GSI_10366 [Ganoderma sinense ZZ0214-1]